MAGQASVVNWMLQGRTGEIHQVVLAQTEQIGYWSVLWQIPVDAAAKDTVMNYFDQLAMAELAVDEPLTFRMDACQEAACRHRQHAGRGA